MMINIKKKVEKLKDKNRLNNITTKYKEKIKDVISNEFIDENNEYKNSSDFENLEYIKNINNKKELKNYINNEFNLLYNSCDEKNDTEIVERIKEIEGIVSENPGINIKKMVHKIISKKMAENYYSDLSKGTKIYILSLAMSLEEMIDIDLPSKVEKEFINIENERGKKEGRFEKEELKNLILNQFAQQIVNTYNESNVFAIPQIENKKNLKNDEIKNLMKYIQKHLGRKLDKSEIYDIGIQIKGNQNDLQIKEKAVINAVEKMSKYNKNRNIDFLIKLMNDEKTLETIQMIFEEKNIIKQLNSMTNDKRKKAIETIGNVLNNEKYKNLESETESCKIELEEK